MNEQERLLDIIGNIYDAALDDSLWDAALIKISDISGSVGANLFVVDKVNNVMPLAAQVRMPTDPWPEYQALYPGDRDPRLNYGFRHPHLPLQVDYMHTTEEDMNRSDYYAFLRKAFGIRYFVGSLLLNDSRHSAVFTVQRTPAERHAQSEHLKPLQILVPHLARAVRLRGRLANVDLRAEAAADAVDRLPFGLVLIDTSGQVLFMNSAAQAMVAAVDGLRVHDQQLRSSNRRENEELQNLIKDAIGCALGSPLLAGGRSGGSIGVSRPSGLRPYAVFVTPLSTQAAPLATERPAVAIFISDPEATPELPEATLQRLYGLTAKEAALAGHLAAGKTLGEAANVLGMARSTARLHLERILSKTQTHRQAELVRLLLASVPLVQGTTARADGK